LSVTERLKEVQYSVTKKGKDTDGDAAPNAASSSTPDAESLEAPANANPSSSAAIWKETLAYTTTLENALAILKERIEQLVKKRRDTSVSLADFGKSLVKMGELEAEKEDGMLPKALTEVGQHTDHLALVYQEQADNENIQVVETIIYYIGICTAIRDVIKTINSLTLTRDTFGHEKAKLIEKKKNLQGQPGKEEVVRKLEVDLNNLIQKHDESVAVVSTVEATFREELVRFHREKQYDMKQLLKAFVDLQLECSGKLKTSWDQIVPSIDSVPVEEE